METTEKHFSGKKKHEVILPQIYMEKPLKWEV